MDVFRRYLCSGGSHRRGISNSESISLERRDSDNERSRQTSRKSKGRETFRSKITANVFVNAFMYLWRSKRYRSFFAFHFSVSVFVVATVTMLDRKIAAVPADNTMRRDVRPSSAVSFPCLLVSPPPLLKLTLFDIFTDEHGRRVVQIFVRRSIYIAYFVVWSPRFPEIFHEIDRSVDHSTVNRRMIPFHL